RSHKKFGLMKKAYELSVLCDCEIALIIFNHSNKLFQYASTDMDKVLLKYTEYNEPHESRTNADIIERKSIGDSESPDPEEPFLFSPPALREKIQKIDEEFDKMMQSYRLSATVPQPSTFSMPVTVPPVQYTALVASTLTDPRLLSPQQPAVQRNSVSPGLPQRPASAGALLGDLGSSNGSSPSPVPNGYISARASPGLLSVSNGNSMGKVVPAKSPPPPSPQMVNSRKPDLRVITSQSKSLLQLTEEELELVSDNAQRLGGSQVAPSLTTPVVSVATPSLLAPFSGMQTAYNTEYQLTSADLTALQTFTPPGLVPGNMAAWQQQPAIPQQQQQQQQQQPQQQPQQQQLSLASISNLVPVGPVPQAALTVNTNPNINIKSEPISPNRDRSTPSSTPSSSSGGGGGQGPAQGQGLVSMSYPGTLHLEGGGQGRSPLHSLSSNGSSYDGSDRDDGAQGGGGPQTFTPSVKRMRLDAWVT
uniref:Myocyte enhancer factor 2d n=1 Tax=Sphaeramia orbicularis TaxID=375764 RepID=A0A673A897_9TELE